MPAVIILVALVIYYLLIYHYMIKPKQAALEESNKKLNLLYELSIGFHESLTFEDSFQRILNRFIGIVNAEVASLFILDDKREFFYCPVAVGPTSDEIEKIKVAYGQGIVSAVEKDKKPLLLNNVSNEKNHFKGIDEKINFQTKSMICVPLFVSDKFKGAIQVINKKDGSAFTEADANLLDTIANLTAIAINNANLIKQLRQK
ncbi:MAG TPA: GAF domain-containing protein [Candidatus Wallbacteria bacterium]|nr:GAF domain-containing protein [Candidatus Wallbacteria bacterium]